MIYDENRPAPIFADLENHTYRLQDLCTVSYTHLAKGSGMIHPNMGTMLCFLTTDCAISSEMIQAALLETVGISFNRISVDGDT